MMQYTALPWYITKPNDQKRQLVIIALPDKVTVAEAYFHNMHEMVFWIKHGFQVQPSGSNVLVLKLF